jgi:nucleotide-binding universal stress UspA family protein
MTQIVVATKLSQDVDPVVERAGRIAGIAGASVRLLHVLPELMPRVALEGRRRRAQARLMDLVRHLEQVHDCRADYRIRHGGVHRCIVRESEDLDAELTVVGGSSDDRPRRLPFRSGIHKCIRELGNALLVVRDRAGAAGDTGEPRSPEPRQSASLPPSIYRNILLVRDGSVPDEWLTQYLGWFGGTASVRAFDTLAHAPGARGPGADGAAGGDRGRSRRSGAAAARDAIRHVAAMRKAFETDLMIVGMEQDDSPVLLGAPRLPVRLAEEASCDALVVPRVPGISALVREEQPLAAAAE